MTFKHPLAFSFAVPLANLVAIFVGAFLTTGWVHGFTPELFAQALGTIGKLFSFGSFIVVALAAIVSFGAWLIIQPANSASGASRLVLLGSATLVAAFLPSLLALVVFGEPALGLAIVAAASGAVVALASRNKGPETTPVSTDLPASPRIGFGKRGL